MRRSFKSKSTFTSDPLTGRKIRQVTSHPSTHHHPFFLAPAYDDAMRWLFFASSMTGRPELYAEELDSKTIVQLTNHDFLN